ncbi:MAG: o-succinylbenzoate synthase [Spirosomataceae bacterium]
MSLRAVCHKHVLDFRFEAGTSRGILTQKNTWFVKIYDTEQPAVYGLGECGPLQGLSIDDVSDFEEVLQRICGSFNRYDLEVFAWNLNLVIEQLIPNQYPSIRFGLETALHDFLNGGKRIIFNNAFSQGQQAIPINGLIWMGEKSFMLRQIEEKLKAGFTTLKMKVGALDFEQECALLQQIRTEFSPEEITLRVDANGAWTATEAQEKLQKLAEYSLHSIEQPIKPRHLDEMAALCASSPVPIALDEELIGVSDYRQKLRLLKQLMPPYIILKPTLLGGFQHCKEWIEVANRLKINWWMTSALESNIGLNAVSQFTASLHNSLPQGLGTGQLYHNNIASPLTIHQGHLYYQAEHSWDLRLFEPLGA